MSNLLNYLNTKKDRLVELKEKKSMNEDLFSLESEKESLELKKKQLETEISKLNSKRDKIKTLKQKLEEIKLFIPASITTTIVVGILSLILSKEMLIGVILSIVFTILGTALSSTLIYKYFKISRTLAEEDVYKIENNLKEKNIEKEKIDKLINTKNYQIIMTKKENQQIEEEMFIIANDIDRIEVLDQISHDNSSIVSSIISRFLNLDWDKILSEVNINDKSDRKKIEKVKKLQNK